jgi:20S proteasome alpha/beta subunit
MKTARFTVGPSKTLARNSRVPQEFAQMQAVTSPICSYHREAEIESSFDFERQTQLMTYQVTLCGRDGVVVASDRCQVWHERLLRPQEWSKNKVKKLFVDAKGKIAWTFSGGYFSDVTAHYLRDFLDEQSDYDERAVENAIKTCGNRACDAFSTTARANVTDILVLVFAESRRIVRAHIARAGTMIETLENQCVSGATDSFVNFFPNRFCGNGDMSVDQLAPLAAYCVRAAHEQDTKYIDGLDIAVYRDSKGRFEFEDRGVFWEEASKLDADLKMFLTTRKR